MTKLTKILGKSYDDADFQNFVRKSEEKVIKKLKKNLRPQLSCLKLTISKHRKTQISTLFYAKLVRKEKLIKTSAVFNTPGESNVKLTSTCVAI